MIAVTIDDARRILKGLDNGVIEGTSPCKGGRAWLSGEFQLCELEALCVQLRHEAGEGAQGAAELVAFWKDAGWREESGLTPAKPVPDSTGN